MSLFQYSQSSSPWQPNFLAAVLGQEILILPSAVTVEDFFSATILLVLIDLCLGPESNRFAVLPQVVLNFAL